jgi:hypothetical protein
VDELATERHSGTQMKSVKEGDGDDGKDLEKKTD